MIRILVTGSRDWDDIEAVRTQLRAVRELYACVTGDHDVVIVHGAAPGADDLADTVALLEGWQVERYPANWRLFGRRAGPIRNQVMVDRGADVCVAFPLPQSVGTWDCVRRARQAGIPVVICSSNRERGS